MSKPKKHLLTNEDYATRKLSSVDQKLVDASYSDSMEGMVNLSADDVMKMAQQAREKYDMYSLMILKIMDKKRAKEVYDFRVTQRYTWRLLAVACWSKWEEAAHIWQPPTNQLAGMALCEVASQILQKEIP